MCERIESGKSGGFSGNGAEKRGKLRGIGRKTFAPSGKAREGGVGEVLTWS
jgi:hypothetical protein